MAKTNLFDHKHPASPLFELDVGDEWIARMVGYNEGRRWLTWLWGPAPGEPGCTVPRELLGAITWRDTKTGRAA